MKKILIILLTVLSFGAIAQPSNSSQYLTQPAKWRFKYPSWYDSTIYLKYMTKNAAMSRVLVQDSITGKIGYKFISSGSTYSSGNGLLLSGTTFYADTTKLASLHGNAWGGGMYFGSTNNRSVRFRTNNLQRMVLDSNGNVGIGTASPNQQLEITKNFRLASTTYNGGSPYGVIYKDGNRFIHDFNYGNNGTVTTSGYNTFVGEDAGNFTMGSTATQDYQSSYNVGLGYRTLFSNTTGFGNMALGYNSLNTNTSGAYNAAIGYGALRANTTSNYNVAIGYHSLYNNNGDGNMALGSNTLYNNTSGYSNVAIGSNTLYNSISGIGNVALGTDAARYIANGATAKTTGNYGLYLGVNTKSREDGTVNENVFGYDAIGKGSNTFTFGNSSITGHYFPQSPTSSANYGLVSLGNGAFDGSTSGYFTGSSSGTVLAINAASGYGGDLANWQVAGASKFKVDNTGGFTAQGISLVNNYFIVANPYYLAVTRISTDYFSTSMDLSIEPGSSSGSLIIHSGSSMTKFNGTTSSFPALKRSGTGLQVRLADDSDFAPITAKNGNLSGVLFTQTATATVANTTTETTLTSTGEGSLTLPANFFTTGKTVQVKGYGYHSAAGNPDITVKIKIGGTTYLTTGTVSCGNSTDTYVELQGTITCRSTGATGTIMAQGFYVETGGGDNHFGMPNTTTQTIDTTTTQTIDVTVQWGTASASNTMSLTNLIIHAEY